MPPWYTGPDPLDLNDDGNTGGTEGNNWFGTSAPVIGFPEDEMGVDLPDDSGGSRRNENANAGDGTGWFPDTGPVLPQGNWIPEEDGPWFPGLDNAAGGAADSVTNGGEYIVGGAGDILHGTVGGTADVIEDSAEWAGGGTADNIGRFGDWAGRGIGGSVIGGAETAGATFGGLLGSLGRESGVGDAASGATDSLMKFMLIGGGILIAVVMAVVLL